MNKEIVQYIQDAKTHGLAEQEIKQNLLDAGWDAATVEESFNHVKVETMKAATGFSAKDTVVSPQPTAMQPSAASPISATTSAPATLSGSSAAPTISQDSHAISDIHFNEAAAPKSKTKLFVGIVVGIVSLAILAGGGYFAYGKYYNNPQKTWDKFVSTYKPDIFQNNFYLKYTDPNTLSESDSSFPIPLKNIFVDFKGQSYTNVSDLEHPIMEADFQYGFGSGNTNMHTGIGIRQIDQDLYFKVGENPFLASMVENAAKKKYDWVKIDFQDLQDQMNKESTQQDKKVMDSLKGLGDKLQKIVEDKNFIKMESVVGTEKINTIDTIHYKASLDKTAVEQTAQKAIDEFMAWGNEQFPNDKMNDEDIQTVKQATKSLVAKYQVKELDLWVGKKDNKLYKVHFLSNMPSFISLMNLALGSAKAQSSDAKRLADIRQTASALELYYNDNDGYPDGKDGIPVGITPQYIGTWPQAPSDIGPACNDYFNTYWYQPTGKQSTKNGKTVFSSFELTFCIGTQVGGYSAGIAKLTPDGIQGNIPCTGEGIECPSPVLEESKNKDTAKEVEEAINKIDFSAELLFDTDYADYGKTKKVEAPSEFFDLNKFIKDMDRSNSLLDNTFYKIKNF